MALSQMKSAQFYQYDGDVDLEKRSQSNVSILDGSEQLNNNTSANKEHKDSAKNYVVSLVTVFYLVILVIYAVVLELSSWLLQKDDKENLKLMEMNSFIFNLYIFILSFMYFAYCYTMYFMKRFSNNIYVNTKMPNIGSLYIRFGAVVFAIVGCVYYIVSVYSGASPILDVFAIIFIIIQTHLLFYSSSMFEDKNFIISCFGTMHLVAANLITWFQFLFAKNRSTQKTIAKNSKKNKTLSYLSIVTTTISSFNSNEEMDDRFNDVVEEMEKAPSNSASDCKWVECIFGSFTKVFYTAVVEYSLIAAAVMYIVWHNLGKVHKTEITHPKQKKSKDPKVLLKQIFGIGIGSAFSIGTLISMALFFVYCFKDEHFTSAGIFSITDIVQNSIGIFACIFAIWRMRSLKYVAHESDEFHANQELLDIILLAIGLIGELAFSIAGLMGIYSVHEWHSLSLVLTTSHIIQIIQSVFQCFIICFASKLRTQNSNEQPGKQSITFLIILNIAMFIYNLFISDKVGTYESIISFYGEQNWVFLVRIFSPLTIFFRFHSSVCFVEIWQHTYSINH